MATFVTADKSSSRRGAKLSPSETKKALAPGRETIPAPLPLTAVRVGVGALEALAIIKSRLCRLAAAKVGVPVGHGYNYFLACDTAERIIFAIVAGSGSGKLCWHSRRNDNDQENAGYVRESAGGSEQA